MASHWNGAIATQTVAFRGTSTVDIKAVRTEFHNFQTISGAAYSLNVTGGVSGSFGVHVVGYIGGNTFTLAGLTAISAVGNYVLYPSGYSSTGALQNVGTGIAIGDANIIKDVVPPSKVLFQSGVATAGISANCTVSAALHMS